MPTPRTYTCTLSPPHSPGTEYVVAVLNHVLLKAHHLPHSNGVPFFYGRDGETVFPFVIFSNAKAHF